MRRPLVFVLLLITLLAPLGARARSGAEYRYSYEQVWSAAIRLLRVDLGCTLVEKDVETGFLLFEYPEGQRVHRGSLELIKEGGERPSVRAVLQLTTLPTYIEQMIVDRLTRKLESDFGDAPGEKPVRPAPAKPSGNKEKS